MGQELSQMQKFETMCQCAETGEDIMKIVDNYDMEFKNIYNKYIGWALASREACNLVVDFWKLHPEKRIVDVGAGTGLFCKVFNYLGIPEDKLLAIDLPNPSHFRDEQKKFWPIHRNDDFKVDPGDILFIAWGVVNIEKTLYDYIDRGGNFIIILGELGELTLDPEILEENDDWIVDSCKVPSPMGSCMERLSISKRK